MAGGKEARALDPSQLRDYPGTKEASVHSWLGRTASPGGRAEAGHGLRHRGALWKWAMNKDPEHMLRKEAIPWESAKNIKVLLKGL